MASVKKTKRKTGIPPLGAVFGDGSQTKAWVNIGGGKEVFVGILPGPLLCGKSHEDEPPSVDGFVMACSCGFVRDLDVIETMISKVAFGNGADEMPAGDRMDRSSLEAWWEKSRGTSRSVYKMMISALTGMFPGEKFGPKRASIACRAADRFCSSSGDKKFYLWIEIRPPITF